ncbi:SpoIIE family protein phosphatase [Actinocorallia longicatena]|uniref:Response regulatory domain-containing protein n=1 Tax=Actinocorallia longicatena TaxID=111803 RepID=A0ABP6QFH3_9ACTN
MNSLTVETSGIALVVDDTATKRYIIGSWLRRAGFTVVEAASAAETWERLAEHEVDLVILDVRLPDLSGIEVCEQIKANPSTASLPVIHISASAVAVTDRTYGLRQGADAYLTDPIDPGEFIATVEAVLRYYRARWRAERLADRLATLNRASNAINAATGFEQLTAVAAMYAAEVFAGPATVIVQPPERQPRQTVCVSPGANIFTVDRAADALDRLGEAVGIGEGTATVLGSLTDDEMRELFPDKITRDDVCVIMSRIKEGRPPIVITISAHRVPDEDSFSLLRQLAQTLALAMEAMRTHAEEHLIALTLQRSLLPSGPPAVPGWGLAVRYEPASDTAEIGGDFYEVLDLDGRILVAIGDVQGHSLEAATVMGELRHALRAFADEGHDAVTIVQRLGSVMRRYHPGQTATVCLLTLDPATGELEIVSAGHLPALRLAGGVPDWRPGGGLLLGFPEPGRVATDRLTVAPGETIVLYTDGLVEDRHVPLDHNLDRLAAIGMPLNSDLERYTDQIIAEFGHREDDVALVVLRRDPI